MSRRFYTSLPLAPGPFQLEGQEAHHLSTVSRAHRGERVALFNGDGLEYPAEVVELARRHVLLQVGLPIAADAELPFRLTIASPLPKGDRGQFLVEKLTELGVQRLVPLVTRRSSLAPGEGKREKLERYVIEASKQCGRNRLMQVEENQSWEDLLARTDLPELRVLAHLGGQPWTGRTGVDAMLAVGPEGGWTEEEVQEALEQGWQAVGLGARTLRVETAAIALAVRFGAI